VRASADLGLQVGGVLVEGPVQRVVAVRQSEARDPVRTARVATTSCQHAGDERRRTDVQLQPLLVCHTQPPDQVTHTHTHTHTHV